MQKAIGLLVLFFTVTTPALGIAAEEKGLCSPIEDNDHRAIFGITDLSFERDRFTMGVEDKGSAVVIYSAINKPGKVTVGLSSGSPYVFSVSPQRQIYVIGNNMFFDSTVCETSGLTSPSADSDRTNR